MNQEFSAAAHAGHDLDQSVLFPPDQFLQVRVASDFHDFALIENDFGSPSVFSISLPRFFFWPAARRLRTKTGVLLRIRSPHSLNSQQPQERVMGSRRRFPGSLFLRQAAELSAVRRRKRPAAAGRRRRIPASPRLYAGLSRGPIRSLLPIPKQARSPSSPQPSQLPFAARSGTPTGRAYNLRRTRAARRRPKTFPSVHR